MTTKRPSMRAAINAKCKIDDCDGLASKRGYGVQVYEHIAIAEAALGRRLPPKARVHHVNGNKVDNRRENLVVCNDDKYHQLLHRRTRALEAVGDPNAIKCSYCGEWDDPVNLLVREVGGDYHRSCSREYSLLYQERLRNARKTGAIIDDRDLTQPALQGDGVEAEDCAESAQSQAQSGDP